jgi:hypothetical protein
MTKLALLTGIAFVFVAQSANATCLPASTNPSNADLAKLIICLQGEIDKIPTTPVQPAPPPPDPTIVHFGNIVDLRFPDLNWCLARGDACDNKAYTLQCAAGTPSGVAHVSIDKIP